VLAIAALRDGRVQGSNCISAGSFVDVRGSAAYSTITNAQRD